MSCFGSTKTEFSASNMSLASSTLMTALSTCTISDADYETSDEQLLSPQIPDKIDAQDPQSSSNHRWSASLLASQSASCLADTSEDFVTSSSADEYAMTVKSDTCLNQQSKLISDFINDMRLQEQQQSESRALSSKNSSTSVQTEFFPSTNASDSPYGSIIDINIADSTDTIEKEITEIRPDECTEEKVSPRSDEKRAVRLTLSETRHKIMENLAQVTSDKLFARAGLRCSSTTKAERAKPASSAGVACTRRAFQRCRGVESLLQIDYELQPLNLMLSRLLAEFRAMDLRGKLGYVEPVARASCTFADSQRRRKDGKFLSHEYLGDNPEEARIAQISRSCEDNCLLSRDSLAACRTELADEHPECSNETERNPRCHRETRCSADRRSQKASSEEDFGGSGVIRRLEIASTN